MTQEQLDKILDACKPVPLIAINCGTTHSLQARANSAWKSLGLEMGFDYMTVRGTGKGDRFFTAEAVDIVPQEWRWIDQQGRAMTNWSDKPPPPPSMQTVSDAKGIMSVEFRGQAGAVMDTFLGKPFDYWVELDARMQCENAPEVNTLLVDALVENAKLKRRIRHIETEWQRIADTFNSLKGPG